MEPSIEELAGKMGAELSARFAKQYSEAKIILDRAVSTGSEIDIQRGLNMYREFAAGMALDFVTILNENENNIGMAKEFRDLIRAVNTKLLVQIDPNCQMIMKCFHGFYPESRYNEPNFFHVLHNLHDVPFATQVASRYLWQLSFEGEDIFEIKDMNTLDSVHKLAALIVQKDMPAGSEAFAIFKDAYRFHKKGMFKRGGMIGPPNCMMHLLADGIKDSGGIMVKIGSMQDIEDLLNEIFGDEDDD